MKTTVFLEEIRKKLSYNIEKKSSDYEQGKEFICDLDDDESLIIDIKNAAFFYATKQLKDIEDKNVDLKEVLDKNYEFYINLVNKIVSFYKKTYDDSFLSVLKLVEEEEYKHIFSRVDLYENLKSVRFKNEHNKFLNTLSLKERNMLSKPELQGIVHLNKDIFLHFDKNRVKKIHIGKKTLDLNSDLLKKMSDEDKNVTGLSIFDTRVRLMFEVSHLEMDEFNRVVRDYCDDNFIYEELLKSICKKLILDDKQLGSRRAIIFMMDYDVDLGFKKIIMKYIQNDIKKKVINVKKRKKDSD